MKRISETLDQVTAGDPTTVAHLAAFPLLGPVGRDPGYLTLDEALEQSCLKITEVSHAGSVPELLVKNRGRRPVLMMDGEELIGAKQNPVMNTTVLINAKSSIHIPVSCVERGRWSSTSARFRSSNTMHDVSSRTRRMSSVSQSMERGRGACSDQNEVWEEIDAKSARMGVESRTGAMSDLYEQYAQEISEYVDALRLEDGIGVAFAMNGHVVGLDLFDHPATLQKLLPKLVRSFAIQATEELDDEDDEPARPSADRVRRFLDLVRRGDARQYPGVGAGVEFRITGSGVTASALVADDRVVHLAAMSTLFPHDGGLRRQRTPRKTKAKKIESVVETRRGSGAA